MQQTQCPLSEAALAAAALAAAAAALALVAAAAAVAAAAVHAAAAVVLAAAAVPVAAFVAAALLAASLVHAHLVAADVVAAAVAVRNLIPFVRIPLWLQLWECFFSSLRTFSYDFCILCLAIFCRSLASRSCRRSLLIFSCASVRLNSSSA